jgi:hypothetical protein
MGLELPKEFKMIFKAAKIRKKDLKNEEFALKTFEIIKKAMASHTQDLMNLFQTDRRSKGTNSRMTEETKKSNFKNNS